MNLTEQLTKKRDELGQAIATAKGIGKELNKLEGDREAHSTKFQEFERAKDAASAVGIEVQEIQGQIELDSLDNLAQGPLAPSVENSLGTHTGAQGSLGFQEERPNGAQRLHSQTPGWNPGRIQGPGHMHGRVISNDEMIHRYTVTHGAHHAGFQAYIRAREEDRGAGMRDGQAAAKAYMEKHGLSPSEVNLHKLVDDSLGGFTVSEDFRAEVIRATPGFTVMRASGARVITTGKPMVSFPVVNRAATNIDQYTSDMDQGDTNWKAEGATQGGVARTPQDKPTFGLEKVPVHIWQPNPIELTMELLDDSDVDLEGLLAELIAETKGMDEDVAFLRGNGIDKPEGILNSGALTIPVGDASLYASPTDGDNGFSYVRIVNMFVGLAAQYRQNANWYMNSDTFGRLLRIEDANKQPLFPINAIPGTLLNRPMWFTEFLDNGSNVANKPIIFGDPRFFVIAERKQLTMMRLVERYAPNIALLPTARVGGQVVLTEAFRIGTVAA